MSRILVIDDDQAIADSIEFVLQPDGHDVIHHATIAEGMKALKASSFDCLLLDVWIGKEDGIEFLAHLRENGTRLPVIVISGGGPSRSLENVTARADALGAVTILYKPFHDDDLKESIVKALDK